MDTVTHGLAGSVLARSASDRPGARAALAVGLIAAMLPDLDILYLRTRLDYLRYHRGWTHSFVVLPVFALLVALAARLVFRRTRLATLWLFAAIGIGSHILFDWITSFGTMFFFPISQHRYSLDWVFILDPIFTGLPAISLIGALVFRKHSRVIAAAGSAALMLYVAFCAVQHFRALEAWQRADQPPLGSRVAALPQFLSPFRWLGLSDRGDAVDVGFFDVGPFARGTANPRPPQRFKEIFASLADFYPPIARVRIQTFPQPPPSPALSAARAREDVEAYLHFARFPRAVVRSEADGGTEIVWEDLRFLPWFAGPWQVDAKGVLRRRPFLFRVRLDAAGRTIESGVVSNRLP
ncbi:MAG TPA: metal-dependent hydrolase [Thermoanaerobaculia bacterium]|nr:metal-dependent hydrolase [Thermoanaerobaculia bacterium]